MENYAAWVSLVKVDLYWLGRTRWLPWASTSTIPAVTMLVLVFLGCAIASTDRCRMMCRHRDVLQAS